MTELSRYLESCFKPPNCPCPDICHPDLPKHPIYELSRLSKTKARSLRADNILTIADIPPEYELTDRQQAQREAVIAEKAIVDKESLNDFLSDLEYPLYFLDYETLGLAIPAFNRYGAYQKMVFQYSLHLQEIKGGGVEYFEYLATKREDPSLELVKHLSENIESEGSMIVWNQSFEIGRNKEMAEMYPEYAELLLGLNKRAFDLMKAFSKTTYIDPAFGGSASLKKVLPALLPDLGKRYSEMTVSNGANAMLTWKELIWANLVQKQQKKCGNYFRQWLSIVESLFFGSFGIYEAGPNYCRTDRFQIRSLAGQLDRRSK